MIISKKGTMSCVAWTKSCPSFFFVCLLCVVVQKLRQLCHERCSVLATAVTIHVALVTAGVAGLPLHPHPPPCVDSIRAYVRSLTIHRRVDSSARRGLVDASTRQLPVSLQACVHGCSRTVCMLPAPAPRPHLPLSLCADDPLPRSPALHLLSATSAQQSPPQQTVTANTNEQQTATTNDERRTTNDERRTTLQRHQPLVVGRSLVVGR